MEVDEHMTMTWLCTRLQRPVQSVESKDYEDENRAFSLLSSKKLTVNIRRIGRMLGIALLLLVIIIFVVIRFAEQKMIFFPTVFPGGYWDTSFFPGQIEDCSFRAEDGVVLHGWFAHAISSNIRPRRTLLFFHGNAGNITHRQTNIAYLIQRGLNVFIFDYRGYGKSEGKPSEQGVYADAVAAYEYLAARKDVQPEHIMFFGRSLGGAVAIELATRKPCEKLIVESTFTRFKIWRERSSDPFRSIFCFAADSIHYRKLVRFIRRY